MGGLLIPAGREGGDCGLRATQTPLLPSTVTQCTQVTKRPQPDPCLLLTAPCTCTGSQGLCHADSTLIPEMARDQLSMQARLSMGAQGEQGGTLLRIPTSTHQILLLPFSGNQRSQSKKYGDLEGCCLPLQVQSTAHITLCHHRVVGRLGSQ